MSVFGSIVSAIFGSKHAAAVTPPSEGLRQRRRPRPLQHPRGRRHHRGLLQVHQPHPDLPADVEAILKKLHDEQREDFDWRKSIVDLMKLLQLDSGLAARKQLAQELGYTGALDGSAEMNVWLHKQVMTKLAESGGKVPDSLKA